jgi:transposase, IS5 family
VDLKHQVERFNKTFGCYPEVVLADKIYMTRENRKYLKEKGIRCIGKPLGRPSQTSLTPYEKQKLKKERNLRNHIEGKFGQGIKYGLKNIKARRQDTSESWIAAVNFVMNLQTLAILAGKYFSSFFSDIKWKLMHLKMNLTTRIMLNQLEKTGIVTSIPNFRVKFY